eukprot:6212709-Pleurochrysis_carterae.AAC.4
MQTYSCKVATALEPRCAHWFQRGGRDFWAISRARADSSGDARANSGWELRQQGKYDGGLGRELSEGTNSYQCVAAAW